MVEVVLFDLKRLEMAVAERKKIVGGEWYGRALERKGSGDTIFFHGLLFVRRRSEPGARVSVLATNGMKTCLSPVVQSY